MDNAVEFLRRRLSSLQANKAEALNDLDRAQSDGVRAKGSITELETAITDVKAAITALGGKAEPIAVIKTLAKPKYTGAKVEGY